MLNIFKYFYITRVVYYNHINHNCDENTFTNAKHRRTLSFQVRTVYERLTSVHGDTRRET